jgi:hypothetical protein
MKNQFTSRIVKLTFAFMFVLIASSCSQDDEAMDAAALANEINSELSAKGAKVVAAVAEGFVVPNEICAGVAANFCFTAAIGTNLQVQQLIAGEWEQVYQISKSTAEETCFPLTFATAGPYQLRYKIGGGGFLPSINGMTVTVTNCGSCTIEGEEFTGAAVSCGTSREANYTFGSEDGVGYFKMQGGLTNFTGGDAVVTIWNGSTNVTGDYSITQVIQGHSSNRRITVVGDLGLGSCGSIRVNIKWDSTNSGGVITGSWSVVDAAGVEYAPEVAGLECL